MTEEGFVALPIAFVAALSASSACGLAPSNRKSVSESPG
jgi:hypothetical protein